MLYYSLYIVVIKDTLRPYVVLCRLRRYPRFESLHRPYSILVQTTNINMPILLSYTTLTILKSIMFIHNSGRNTTIFFNSFINLKNNKHLRLHIL